MQTQNTIWLVVSLLILIVAASLWVSQRMKRHRARSWAVGDGQVVATDLHIEGAGTQQAHVAQVTYSYMVQGQLYSGSLRRRFMLHGSATKWIGSYEKGRPLVVRYNPNNVRDSVLFESEQVGGDVSRVA
jgi:uncharacterized protein DUF3592